MTVMTQADGSSLDVLHFHPDQLRIENIAAQLAKENRFGGATRRGYPVAAHSLHVSHILEEQGHSPSIVFAGLMHDGHEAILGDVIQPIKAALRHISMSMGYQLCPLDALERQLATKVAKAFGFLTVMKTAAHLVHAADMIALATERRDLLPPTEEHWACLDGFEPHWWKLHEHCPTFGEFEWAEAFLDRFQELDCARKLSLGLGGPNQ